MKDNNPPSENEQKKPRSLAEWVTFIIALGVLGIVTGLVIYKWIIQEDEPPILTVSRSEIRSLPGQFYVPFEVTNSGGETAESVQVIAELRINGEVEESGEQQIDFLAAEEKEEGAFIFSRNPQEGELVIRVASYKLP